MLRLLAPMLPVLGILLAAHAAAEETVPNVHIVVDEEAGEAVVNIRGEHFTTLHFGEDARTPILWPVNVEGGVCITRNWPMGEDEPESRDHIHHRSLWTAYGDVNGADTWHRAPITVEKIEAESGDERGWIRIEATWRHQRRNVPLVSETRTYRFHDTEPSARIIDQKTVLTANHGEVLFGDDKEGFFALRIRPDIQGNRAGVLTSATGAQGESDVYGVPAPWMDYSGMIEGVGARGIAIMSHPDNFRLPAWHVRDYGLMGCNFFAMQSVAGQDEPGDVTLAEGESLTLQARFFVHTGDAEEADVAARYAEYVAAAGQEE